jgi:hypothetical protein
MVDFMNQIKLIKVSLKTTIKWLFFILQKNNNIIRAEKYSMGIKIKEWNSLSEFKKTIK